MKNDEYPHTCVTPQGFRYGIHKPSYRVVNLRQNDYVQSLGGIEGGGSLDNQRNFPAAEVRVEDADWIYEIPNPLSFRGTTYISRSWAEDMAASPEAIRLPEPPSASMSDFFDKWGRADGSREEIFKELPPPVLLSLAANSTDARDLIVLARLCCAFAFSADGQPLGLRYQRRADGGVQAIIHNHDLFEILVNNYYLPDVYKEVMVLRPGAQGGSEIVGEVTDGSHVFEYLRRNSYIAGGHYAANMANDAIRYHIRDLSRDDIRALRHIYYQRSYVRLSAELGMPEVRSRQPLAAAELEEMRLEIQRRLRQGAAITPALDATIWGWNYGYGCSSDNYRLHASHQMIHQQFSMLAGEMETVGGPALRPYGCGDLIAEFMGRYQAAHGSSFFDDYYRAIRQNTRLDGRTDLDNSLIVYEDEGVILFVPKAQTSQWELQLMPLTSVGNIVEVGHDLRESIDAAILTAMRILAKMGARMITVIEYSKRLGSGETGQRLLYSFLPKLPQAPGAFSEAQLRWISGHYPEDFARACRMRLP